MTLSVLAAFWAVSFLFVITPGADWAYAISAGLFGRVVMPAVAGLLIGHLVATLVVAAGVGGLVANNPIALSVITVAGATYLLWRQHAPASVGSSCGTSPGIRFLGALDL